MKVWPFPTDKVPDNQPMRPLPFNPDNFEESPF